MCEIVNQIQNDLIQSSSFKLGDSRAADILLTDDFPQTPEFELET